MNPFPGQVIDQKYRLESLLGQGGMGSVYRAHDLTLDRPVAIKVLHPQLATQPQFRQRFLLEARAAAQLDHPSIIKIYDFAAREDQYYMVMEYVAGRSLAFYLHQLDEQGQILPLREVLSLMAQVADGLAYAHRRGVVHRDIKPDNILIKLLDDPERPDEAPLRAVTTDFGLAKLLQGGAQTQTGAFMGTLSYMAPEQTLSQPVDGRADIYAMGVMLFQLATGRLPFDISTPTDAVVKHLQATPPTPQSLRPDLPVAMVQLIEQAMARDPLARFQSADTLALRVRAVAASLDNAQLASLEAGPAVNSLLNLSAAAEKTQPPVAPPPAAPKPRQPAATPHLSLTLDKARRTLPPGQTQPMQLRLLNEGEGVEEVMLSISGLSADWISLPAAPLSIDPEQEITVTLTWRPPPNAPAGLYAFRLTATVPTSTRPVASVAGQITITPLERLITRLEPGQVTADHDARLIVENNGNVAARFHVQARAVGEGVSVRPADGAHEVEPGEEAAVNIHVAALKRPLWGRTASYPFELVVRTSTGARQTETGAARVPPRLPLAWTLVVAGLALITLAANVWLGGGSPVGESLTLSVTAAAIAIDAPATAAATLTPTLTARTTPLPSLAPTPTPVPSPTAWQPATLEIGRSVNGAPIEAMRFGGGERALIFIGGLHAGFAPASVTVAQEAITYFSDNPGAVPGSLTLYIVPNANPDSATTPGDLLGRLNANKVDLNRNWDCNWIADPLWRGATLSGAGGTAPFSEPETRALSQFILDTQPAVVVLWMARSTDGLVSPGRCGARTQVSAELTTLYGTAAGYNTADFTNLTGVGLNGDSADWLDSQGIPAISVLLPDYTNADWRNNRLAILALLRAYASLPAPTAQP